MQTPDGEIPIRIPLLPVTSSNLAAVGYDDSKQILAVQFASGAIFHYAGVPVDLAIDLVKAESVGKFYATHIKGKFQGQKMTGPCPNCGDSGWIGDTCEDCGTAPYADAAKEASNGTD